MNDVWNTARRRFEGLVAIALVLIFCALLLKRDPGFFWNDDYQAQYLPALRDMGRAWETGESILLSPSSWFGGALAGEYQHGTFSIFIQLLAVLIWKLGLSLPATAAVFSMTHLAVLATGAFCLARQRRLSADLATFAALVTSLNGWIICWASTDWIPALSSFAWLPWGWWALERSLDSERGWIRILPAILFIYLILTAGWPFTVLMMGVVTCFVLVRAGMEKRGLWVLWPVPVAWAWGGALAAPALLMLVEYVQIGLRVEQHQGLQWQWVIPPSAALGLVTPSFMSEWYGWEGRYVRPAVELASGLVPQVVLAAALARARLAFVRRFRWELLALGLVFVLGFLPSPAPFQMSFRWLPLFHLLLGLLGAHALATLRAEEHARASDPESAGIRVTSTWLVTACIVFPVLKQSIFIISSSLFAYLEAGTQVLLVVLVFSLTLLSWILLRRSTFARIRESRILAWRWLPCLAVLVSLGSTYATVSTRWVARWNFPEAVRETRPFEASRLYLGLYSREEAYSRESGVALLVRPGNIPMLSGARFVNGYTPIRPAGLAWALGMESHLGFTTEAQARRIVEREVGTDGMLELMGVDGLVLAARWEDYVQEVVEHGWTVVSSSGDGTILHRNGPPSAKVRALPSVTVVDSPEIIGDRILTRASGPVPRLVARPGAPSRERIEYAPCRLDVRHSSRRRVEVEVSSSSRGTGSLVLFSRPWYPGYQADLDGRPLEVLALDRAMPAVEIPAGAEGLLTLAYTPISLRIGLAVSGSALALGLITFAGSRIRRRWLTGPLR